MHGWQADLRQQAVPVRQILCRQDAVRLLRQRLRLLGAVPGAEDFRNPSFEKHLNKYDVIYLDITEFTSDAFAKRQMQDVVINLERKVIDELSVAYTDVARQDDLPNMLYGIAEATRHKFLFIIDECW